MNTIEIPAPKSIFASIDQRSAEFTDDVERAKEFTRLVLDRSTDAPDIEMVHLTSDDTPQKDDEGKEYFRRYAIWKEHQNLFGAWVFVYEDEAYENTVIYPHILGPVTKKSHEIVEDIYYIEKMNLPVAWVTYHNAQM